MNFFMNGNQIDWGAIGVGIGVLLTGMMSYLTKRQTYQINDAVNHRHEKSADGLKLYDVTAHVHNKVKHLLQWQQEVDRRDRLRSEELREQSEVLAEQSQMLADLKAQLTIITANTHKGEGES